MCFSKVIFVDAKPFTLMNGSLHGFNEIVPLYEISRYAAFHFIAPFYFPSHSGYAIFITSRKSTTFI